MTRFRPLPPALALLFLWVGPDFHAVLRAEPPSSPAQLEFFESRIRPVLVEHCYACHNTTQNAEGGLSVDHRQAMAAGSDSGPIVVAGKPSQSKLIAVLRHDIDGLEMPEGGARLDEQVVADFEQWIKMGAPDPRDAPPTAEEVADATSWESTLMRRKGWWSFQPIEKRDPPLAINGGPSASGHPIDRFIQSKLAEVGLTAADPADPPTLVRRLFLTLTGLPPTRDQFRLWSDRIGTDGSQATTELIDHLLNSEHFGERWARHWMDWIRYAESHGSEGDPAIDNAWIYRDYLIRALNQDIPYDQLVREHVAGDLLESPRLDESLGINESIIGPAHWRMVFHGFAPTDALDEKVRFIDDQVNAFSKAFLGLTVSCARCHDHKFDAISQADYYALFGILASCRPARAVIDLPDRQLRNREQLTQLKTKLRTALASDWLNSLPSLKERLNAGDIDMKSANKVEHVLNAWQRLQRVAGTPDTLRTAWKELVQQRQSMPAAESSDSPSTIRWDLSRSDDYETWYQNGIGLPARPSPAGEFAVAATGDTAITGIYPAGVFSHLLSAKHPARLTSRDFHVGKESEIWVQAIGDAKSSVRYVIQDYPRNGTVYPVRDLKPNWTWQQFDLSYWQGDSAHLELTTAKDAPLLVKNESRSWFGLRKVRVVPKGQPAPQIVAEHLGALVDAATQPPSSLEEVAAIYVKAIGDAIEVWKSESASDSQAILLDGFLKSGLLPNEVNSLKHSGALITQYRKREGEIPVPTRIPGLDETNGRTQPLFVRGNHQQPGDDVPRRFLEAIDAAPYDRAESGRRQLAEDLLRSDNPLTRRVIVNRVWHHLFGRGIVSTPDNFGRLGDTPSHGELLDWLALRFEEDGWSIKKLIRLIVSSQTWQQSSQPSNEAKRIDPNNQFLSHANVRRLEAEAIRDSLLAAAGTLERKPFGPPVGGDANRRSIYVRVIRNNLDPLLRVFDFPEPFSTTGRRDITNVPAQSLTLMNDPLVKRYAAGLASSMLADESHSDQQRLSRMFVTLFSRDAEPSEIAMAVDYLQSTQQALAQKRTTAEALRDQIDKTRTLVAAILDPVRTRMEDQARADSTSNPNSISKPIARWEFDQDLRDSIGSIHGVAHGDARIEDGALVVQSGAYVTTAPITQNVSEKTLEAWVELDNLKQRGGGVMTLQTTNGVIFDSIVFGEQEPRRWLAGSNGFTRTKPFTAKKETEATNRSVHVAIVYHNDGRITGYRDGKPYGKTYQSNGPLEFKKGESIISFGVRHLPAGGNRLLSGRIERAQLYDRALTVDEIAASFEGNDFYVSAAKVFAALPQADRQKVDAARERITSLEARLASLGELPSDSGERQAWTDLAHALLTLQEFIYVR